MTATGIAPGALKLSPDGRRLLYGGTRAGTSKSELWVKSLADNRETLLTLNDEYKAGASWSRDGTRRLPRSVLNCTGRDDLSIFVLPAAGGKEAVIASGAEELVWDWSADGQWLLVSSARATPRRWGVLPCIPWQPLRTLTRKAVITSHPEHSLFQARFSPDDCWVVFQATKAGAQAVVYVVSSSGGDWTRITEDDVWSDKPQWSPDGKTIDYSLTAAYWFFNVWGIRFDRRVANRWASRSASRPLKIRRMVWPSHAVELAL